MILVDWLNGAGPYDIFYPLAVVNTELVGRQIAVLLYQLMSTYALKPVIVHYVGHSLGAQCGHFFAEYFKKISGGMRINQITGELVRISRSTRALLISKTIALTDDSNV